MPRAEQGELFPVMPQGQPQFREIPISRLTSRRVRVTPEFVESIRANGVLVPIIVVETGRTNTSFRVVDGNRRVAAIRRVHQESRDVGMVPAMIYPRGTTPAQLAVGTLAANMHRGYNVIAELEAIETLLRNRPGITAEGIADRLGISRSMVNRRMRLMNLIPALRIDLSVGELPLNSALLLATRSHADQNMVREHCQSREGVRPTVQLVRNLLDIPEEPVARQAEAFDPSTVTLAVDLAVGWHSAASLVDQLIRVVPEPSDTDDPQHVEDLIFRLNTVAELIHVMNEDAGVAAGTAAPG